MYELMVQRDFIAQHFLTVPDCGPENTLHSHHFEVEVRLEGNALNKHGYLVDITDVEAVMDRLVDRYRDATLNDQDAFEGLNPSVEHFARIVAEQVRDQLGTRHLEALSVRIWEDEHAWAAYRVDDLS
jgi:6-pyruvoyltetrahydropterin/6-carboxytetrahydropterin synthase